jgi:hypothetical protein
MILGEGFCCIRKTSPPQNIVQRERLEGNMEDEDLIVFELIERFHDEGERFSSLPQKRAKVEVNLLPFLPLSYQWVLLVEAEAHIERIVIPKGKATFLSYSREG